MSKMRNRDIDEKEKEQGMINPVPNSPAPVKKKKTGPAIVCVVLAVALVLAGVYFIFLKGTIGKKSILENKEKLAEITASVLKLECYDDEGNVFTTGSGFVAFSDNVVVTNYHVIEDHPYAIKALSEGGREFEIEAIVSFNQEMDIAILKTRGSTGLTPLTFAEKAVEKTDKVVAIGSPLGLMNTVSDGIVSGFTQIGKESVIQFTASISHGSSGGVLLNETGEVVGVTFASFSEGQNLNVAIPIKYVSDLYSREANKTPKSVLAFYNEVDHTKTYSINEVKANVSKHRNEEMYVVGYLYNDDYGHYYLVNDITLYNELIERREKSRTFMDTIRKRRATSEEKLQESYNNSAKAKIFSSLDVLDLGDASYELLNKLREGKIVIVHGKLNAENVFVVDAADYYN